MSQFVKLDQLHLPGTLLLGGNGLQSHGSVAVPAAAVVEDNVYFLHGGHCGIRLSFAAKSTLYAMWITKQVSCAQGVPWAHSRRIRRLFTDCSYPRTKIEPCDAISTCTRLLPECSPAPASAGSAASPTTTRRQCMSGSSSSAYPS